MRIAICGSDKAEQKQFQHYIESWKGDRKVVVRAYENVRQFLYNWSSGLFDMVCINAEQLDATEIEMVKEIRVCSKNIEIVLMRENFEAVYQGYEVGAFYYLLRPLEEEQCRRCFDMLEQKMNENANQYLLIEEKKEVKRLSYRDIRYAKANGRYVILHTKIGILKVRKNLEEMKKVLLKGEFLDIHRSYMVNPWYIEKLKGGEVWLSSGDTLPVSRTKRKEVKEIVSQYYA